MRLSTLISSLNIYYMVDFQTNTEPFNEILLQEVTFFLFSLLRKLKSEGKKTGAKTKRGSGKEQRNDAIVLATMHQTY